MRALLFALLVALPSMSLAQCDPPDTIDEIGETCPSQSEAPDTSVTFPDPVHCSEYYECYNGCATHQLCAENYLYDDYYMYCNFPEQVICGDRDCDGRPCYPYDVPDDFDFECTEPEGTYAYPDNCMKYIQCHSNYPVILECGLGDNGDQLLWCDTCDEGKGWCDYEENVDCGDRPICDSNDENCADTLPGGCDSVTCESDGFVELGPCEPCTCQCTGGVAEELCCSAGLYWNPDTEACSDPASNPGC